MATPRQTGLVKGLGLIDSTTLVMGSMIGSGVFIVAADISRQVQSPGLLIMNSGLVASVEAFVTTVPGSPSMRSACATVSSCSEYLPAATWIEV